MVNRGDEKCASSSVLPLLFAQSITFLPELLAMIKKPFAAPRFLY
jgi:hypothetical protein